MFLPGGFELLLVLLVLPVIWVGTAVLASRRGRSPALWLIAAVLAGPVAPVVLLLVPRGEPEPARWG